MKYENVELVYNAIDRSYHSIREFRVKLLGFLPLASGTGITLILKYGTNRYFFWIGIFGAATTFGLLLYEFHNIYRCKNLITRGALIESGCLHLKGQFASHPAFGRNKFGNFHSAAAIAIYLAVMAGWGILAYEGCKQTNYPDKISEIYSIKNKVSEFVERSAFSKKFLPDAKYIFYDGRVLEIKCFESIVENGDKIKNQVEMVKKIGRYKLVYGYSISPANELGTKMKWLDILKSAGRAEGRIWRRIELGEK